MLLAGILSFAMLSCSGDGESSNQEGADKNFRDTDTLATYSDFITYSTDAVTGATVYVPVYSHIYQRNAQRTFNLTATLSIRNTDLSSSITITRVYYYDSKGTLVQKYLESPKEIMPLSSVSYVVEEDDLRGGVGANFLVIWEAQHSVAQPVIESVMISAAQSQGISFVSEGRIIHSLDSDSPSNNN
ncbi:DUF3124 domain-containing protein [Fodinibius sp. Rm-B-1B1-1]|uniref:DUF3124 domain-containing protein n=1 Tax=Fodinibius alkaliphilus TaxID=3140241 RepID=UPI00315B35B5